MKIKSKRLLAGIACLLFGCLLCQGSLYAQMTDQQFSGAAYYENREFTDDVEVQSRDADETEWQAEEPPRDADETEWQAEEPPRDADETEWQAEEPPRDADETEWQAEEREPESRNLWEPETPAETDETETAVPEDGDDWQAPEDTEFESEQTAPEDAEDGKGQPDQQDVDVKEPAETEAILEEETDFDDPKEDPSFLETKENAAEDEADDNESAEEETNREDDLLQLFASGQEDLIIDYSGGSRISRSSVIEANKDPDLVANLIPLIKQSMITSVEAHGLTSGYYQTSGGQIRPVGYLSVPGGYHTYTNRYVIYRTSNFDIRVTIDAAYNAGTVNAPLALALDNVAVSGRYRFYRDEGLTDTQFSSLPARGTYTAMLVHVDVFKTGSVQEGTYLKNRIDLQELYAAFTDIDNAESHRCLNEPFYPADLIVADPQAFDMDDSNSGMYDYVTSGGDIYSQFPSNNQAAVLNVATGADVYKKTEAIRTEGLDLVYGFRSPANSGIALYTATGKLTVRKNIIRLGTGTLTVRNSAQEEAESGKTFLFTITLKDASGNPLEGYRVPWTGKGMSGVKTTDAQGQFTISLAGGQEASFTNIPAGTAYRVSETPDPEYTLAEETMEGAFPSAEQSGTASRAFRFHVTITDPDGNPASGLTLPFSGSSNGTLETDPDGHLTFVLRGDQSRTLSQIPSGYQCHITEDPVAHYTNTANENTDPVISYGGTDVTRFTNRFDPGELEVSFLNIRKPEHIKLPVSGKRGLGLSLLAGLVLLAAGTGVWLSGRKKGG